MDKNEIFQIIKTNTIEIINGIDEKCITEESSLRELGTNSIDRAEIIIMALEKLQIRVPMVEFASAKNINELCEILLKKYEAQKQQ